MALYIQIMSITKLLLSGGSIQDVGFKDLVLET